MKRTLLTLLLTIATASIATKHAASQSGATQANDARPQVLRVDAAFRVAKLKNDLAALGHILADDFHEINQNGNGRDKAQFIELFETFKVMSLTMDEARVRVTGSTAVITGSQTEVNITGTDRMLFTRVYTMERGHWRLLASTQFRDPKA